MKKATKKKVTASKKAKKQAAKPVRAAVKRPAKVSKKSAIPAAVPPKTSPTSDGQLSFNHAMVYLKDVQRGIEFYRNWLGFKVIEDYRHEGRSVYARMHAPGGDGTIALHQAGPGASVASDGVRLYFELPNLDEFCEKLRRRGFVFTHLPQMMPWGWRHAYLNDPEGHEISLYWAGELRTKKTVMKAAKEAADH
jgi:catechol 2,3-dioxygenase-like lactoylglutathione lyase family enzyme